MSFQSVLFFGFFLPVTLLVHWALSRGRRPAAWQNAWLVLVGWVFFYSWSPRLLAVLVCATAINFAGARALSRLRPAEGARGAAADAARRRTRFLFLALLAYDLGQLLVFKYLGFFTQSVVEAAGVFGLPLSLSIPTLALPLGISFWTLQQVGYLVDVYEERVEACASPVDFAAFSGLFMQLQAGPIARSDLLEQLREPRAATPEELRVGALRFFRGFVARFLVAAVFGEVLVDPAFAHAGDASALRHWLGIVGYAVQVFCDFAGYSDMAIGCGLLFGLRLRENFNAPLLASNPLELWRRWHMSFTNWLFDYVYSPLMTGDGWLRGRLDLGFVVAFLASGLWHGAAWTFVLWGGLQGLTLVVHRRYDEAYRRLCRKDRKWVALRKSPRYAAAGWLVTQAAFVVSLVPFRATSMSQALAYARGLVGHGARALPRPNAQVLLNLAVCAALFVAYHLLRGRAVRVPAPVRGVAYGLLIVYLAIFMPLAKGTFIYAQF